MTPPKVSVILPTYDRPEYLRKAVDSVGSQTYENVELVVVDDHSPTPAAETLDEVDGVEIRIVRHEENRGANEARNTGIDAADGRYIAFLDDDDTWHPKKLERQVRTFDTTDSDVGVVYTGTRYEYGSYNRIEKASLSGQVTKALLRGGSFGQFSTLLVDAAVIEESGALDTRFPSWQDREWLLRLSTCCAFDCVEAPLTVRRRMSDEESITDNFEEKRDVSYPLFLSKHRSLASEYGEERAFVASLSSILGECALKNGYYADARKYLLKSLYYGPLDPSTWVYAVVSLGGGVTYEPLSGFVHKLHQLDTAGAQR